MAGTSRAKVALDAREPRGIVIRDGGSHPVPSRFWAYLWAAELGETGEHPIPWHDRVPMTTAAGRGQAD